MGRTKPLKPKSRQKLVLLNLALLVIPIGYLASGLILRNIARILIVDQAPVPSDAIAVLAGDPGRAVKAADLFKRNVARFIVITTEQPPAIYEKARRDGIALVQNHENYLRLLLGYGVPALNIFRIEPYVDGTFDEVRRIGEFARQKQWTRLIIVTSSYHTRRTRMVARYLLQPDIRVAVVASDYDSFNPQAWWRSQGQTRTFAIEVEKLITYSLYIWPRMLWKTRESTKPRNTLLVPPDSFSMPRCWSIS